MKRYNKTYMYDRQSDGLYTSNDDVYTYDHKSSKFNKTGYTLSKYKTGLTPLYKDTTTDNLYSYEHG